LFSQNTGPVIRALNVPDIVPLDSLNVVTTGFSSNVGFGFVPSSKGYGNNIFIEYPSFNFYVNDMPLQSLNWDAIHQVNCLTDGMTVMASPNQIYPGSGSLVLFKSVDGGKTFQDMGITLAYSFNGLSGSPDNIIGDSAYESSVYRSTDGGYTWDKITSGFVTTKQGYSSIGDGTNFALAPYDGNTIYTSTNGGLNWVGHNVFTLSRPHIRGTYPNAIVASSAQNKVLVTSDWFNTSSEVSLPSNTSLYNPHLAGDNNFFIIIPITSDDRNIFYYTIDNGYNWKQGQFPVAAVWRPIAGRGKHFVVKANNVKAYVHIYFS
jgi:hypothetical protein